MLFSWFMALYSLAVCGLQQFYSLPHLSNLPCDRHLTGISTYSKSALGCRWKQTQLGCFTWTFNLESRPRADQTGELGRRVRLCFHVWNRRQRSQYHFYSRLKPHLRSRADVIFKYPRWSLKHGHVSAGSTYRLDLLQQYWFYNRFSIQEQWRFRIPNDEGV